MPNIYRWKPVLMPRRCITRGPVIPPIIRKPRRLSLKSASLLSWVVEMAPYVRLRQICLVAPHLEPVISDISAIMGLNVCYRDGNVAKYGLENALLPVDTILLEVVAPFQPGTAAGRFIDKTKGRGGYMAIFCCDDPDQRGRHAKQIGVRVANVIDHAPYRGVQLHPRDCRAAFIEFNHTDGSDDSLGPYPPAGPDWQQSIRKDVTQALTGVEMQSPEPEALAQHWGRILGIPVSKSAQGDAQLVLPNAVFSFVQGKADIISGLTFRVADVAKVRDAARAKGLAVKGDSFFLGGVDFDLVA